MEENTDELLIKLRDAEAVIRRHAARRLNHFSSPEVVTALIDALSSDPAPQVRWTAAWSLAIIKSERAIEPLISALQDDNPHVRHQVALAVGQFPAPEFVKPIIAAIENNNLAAAETLLKFNHLGLNEGLEFDDLDKATQLLLRVLEGQFPKLRANAACALGRYGDSCVESALITSLMDRDAIVRLHSVQGLARLNSNKTLNPLKQCLTDYNYSVRIAA